MKSIDKNLFSEIQVKNLPMYWKVFQNTENNKYYIFYIDECINKDKPLNSIQSAFKQIREFENFENARREAKDRYNHLNRLKYQNDIEKQGRLYASNAPEVLKLKESLRVATLRMNYSKILQIKKEIEEKESSLLAKYICENGVLKQTLADFLEGTSEENRNKCKFYLHTVTMLSDIINYICLEIEEIIKDTDFQSEFSFFEDLRELGKLTSQKINFMSNNTDEEYQIKFADFSEELKDEILKNMEGFFRYLDDDR